jgi:hypothetical protein
MVQTQNLTLEQIKALAVYDVYSDGIDAAMRVGEYVTASDLPECPHAEGTADYDWWQRGFDYGTDCLAHGLDPDADNSKLSE